MNFLRLHPFLSAAALVAAVLLVVIGFETGWGKRLRPALPAVAAKGSAGVDARVLPTVVARAPEQAYPESVERPLFVPSRRPAPAAPPPAAAPAMAKGTLTLQGVTIAGGNRIAMLREKQSGRIHRIEQGKQVNGMSVATIESDHVVLRLGDESETVPMLVSRAGGASGTPGAAPPPPAPPPGGPFAVPAAPPPGSPPAPVMQGSPPGAPPPGSLMNPAARAADPGQVPPPPTAAAAAPGQPQPNAAPMSPEELLARRRARRNQQ